MAEGLADYIRRAAQQRGIDPNVAIRVAQSEGGLNDPIRQSDFRKNGLREPSYGPFQLLVGGAGTGFPSGLGNVFMERTGLDPRQPENALAGIDFALDTAAKKGWGQWYGAKRVGLDNFAGIGGRPANVTTGGAVTPPVQGAAQVTSAPPVAGAPTAFGDFIAPSAAPDFGSVIATYLAGRQRRDEQDAAEQSRRNALLSQVGSVFG